MDISPYLANSSKDLLKPFDGLPHPQFFSPSSMSQLLLLFQLIEYRVPGLPLPAYLTYPRMCLIEAPQLPPPVPADDESSQHRFVLKHRSFEDLSLRVGEI